MNENIQFLQAFFKNPLKVGAITPSSPDLAQKMLEDICPGRDSVILELGVGTGAITKFIRRRVKNGRSYLGIELDRNLVRSLNRKFPDLKIIRGNACQSFLLHRRSGLGEVKYIISCLPFVSIPNEVVRRILGEIDKFMDRGCLFRTFQYAHGYYLPSAIKLREHMRKRYGPAEKSPLIVKNVPPAYTLTWRTF